MTAFVHDDPEFDDLVRIVAARHGLAPGLVEKDYWVTHTLWALHEAGFELWFKGGTSLSKGFGLITRFSEDLDLKIEAGRVAGIPAVSSWRGEGKRAVGERAAYFRAVAAAMAVPGASAFLGQAGGERWRGAEIQVVYQGRHLADLAGMLRPYVLLEVGNARVTPAVARDLSSFVHDHLWDEGMAGGFIDNRPLGVRCVHPLVTLIEKLDALAKRVPRPEVEPASFVRHFEDAARIIEAEAGLPPLDGYADVRALAAEMVEQGQIKMLPRASQAAFHLAGAPREAAIRAAHAAIGRMFWGARVELDGACAVIRGWLAERFPAP